MSLLRIEAQYLGKVCFTAVNSGDRMPALVDSRPISMLMTESSVIDLLIRITLSRTRAGYFDDPSGALG